MSALSVILITLSFTAVSIYYGNTYTKFNMSRETWLIITIITCAIFTIKYLSETFTKKKEE